MKITQDKDGWWLEPETVVDRGIVESISGPWANEEAAMLASYGKFPAAHDAERRGEGKKAIKEQYLAQGIDPNGVPRVWAYGWTASKARDAAWEEALEYLKRRPDTGPFSGWEVVVEVHS